MDWVYDNHKHCIMDWNQNILNNRHAGQIKGTLQQVRGREEDARNLAGADATRPTFLTVCCEN